MNSIALMVEEHDHILQFNKAVRNACLQTMQSGDIHIEDFRKMIVFARNYADKHHHGKEEQILFKEMVDKLGRIGNNLITHGMLVEHDLGRLYISELEIAIDQYEKAPSAETKLDIISNAVGYTKLLKRHIDKENEVVYTYAEKNLSEEVLNDVNERTELFEKEAECNNVKKDNIAILNFLANKYGV